VLVGLNGVFRIGFLTLKTCFSNFSPPANELMLDEAVRTNAEARFNMPLQAVKKYRC
jgi:hypothetical protein